MALVGRRAFMHGTGTAVAAVAVASAGGRSVAAQAFEAQTERYKARVAPLVLGLVARDGAPLEARSERVNADGVFLLDRASDSITFANVIAPPTGTTVGFHKP